MFKVCGCIWVVVGYSLSRLQLLQYYQEQLERAMESAVVPTAQKWFCWSESRSCSTTGSPSSESWKRLQKGVFLWLQFFIISWRRIVLVRGMLTLF